MRVLPKNYSTMPKDNDNWLLFKLILLPYDSVNLKSVDLMSDETHPNIRTHPSPHRK